jgi:capsular exopolysaccharide synthesis family protein
MLQMLWRQRRLIAWCAGACLVISFIYLLFAARVYTATSRVLVQRVEPVIMTPEQHPSDDSGANDNFLSTQCELIRSTPILSAVVGDPKSDDMQTFDGVKNRMSYLKRNITADVGKKDDIITVSFDSKYPDEAVKIVDDAVSAYQKYCAGKKRETANEVMNILEKEKAKNETELADVNQKIIDLKKAAHTFSFDNDKSNYTMMRLNSLSDALTAAHLETINARTALEAAAKTIHLDADSIPDNIAGNVALSPKDEDMLRAQLVALNEQLQERRRIYLPDHPQIKALEDRINQLNMSYIGASKVRWDQAKVRETELQKSFEEEQAKAIDISAKAAEAGQLEADAKRIQQTIDGLEGRIKDVSVVVDSGALNITVLEFASYEDNPVKPSKAQVPAIALVIGLLIGCCIAVTREMADPKLHSSDDVKAVVGAQVLGMVPRQTPASTPSMLGQIVEMDPHSEVAEAMRAVRTSLTFGVPLEQSRSILVTSPEPGDGKSTVAANLAIALANAGKRVLLVDGDLRNSTLHEIFGISNQYGFADILAQHEPLETAVIKCSVTRLGLMPGGPAPMAPSELLNDPAFGEILQEAYRQYDHVVIDSPPVMRVDDARIMAATCDCTVLVARAEKTSQGHLRHSVDRLSDVGALLAGIVLNASQAGSRYGRYGRYGETKNSSANQGQKKESRERAQIS